MIRLGDLSVEQMEERLGISFPKEIKDFMKKSRQHTASNIAKGKWHCFDIPFEIVCGDVDVATKIFNGLKDQSERCKERLFFSVKK